MSEELEVAGVPQPEPEDETTLVHLVARNPQEMAAAQSNLAAWFQNKVILCAAELNELTGAVAEAKAHKWKSSTLENQRARAAVRKTFYEKCLLACEQGYTIIPNIPIDIFAIRTTRMKPRPNQQETRSEWENTRPSMPDETPQVLPAGEGSYQSPIQRVENDHSSYVDEKGKKMHLRTTKAVSFDAVEFPIIAAVPSVMSATHQAMAERVFDQIGVSPKNTRKGDPLIIGQIQGVTRGYSGRQTVSFLIAWHLDLRTL